MEVNDKSKEFMDEVTKDLVKKFTKAGIYFTSALRGHLNVAQPYKRSERGNYKGSSPSAPGQFPKKLSGSLQKSMTWDLDKKKLVLTCGSNLKGYPSILQHGNKYIQSRPWLTLGFDLEQATISKIITGK